ncbi:hypothetical protein B0H17DRAFT_1220721 [Mycena rosella]|uniref:Berberine/berberine-like domain-containing protein n=1 Tax=Mycena rosella TaxID=1033263 RepID=A0AAD7FBB1_MYCRO|nr:hypothetical protein B0H17DRAFT_1220721 [Mycena rosella]
MFFDFRHMLTFPVLAWISSLLNHTFNDSRSCKTIPLDATWPSKVHWNNFNEFLGGRLIRTIPIAQSCHTPKYDEAHAWITDFDSPSYQGVAVKAQAGVTAEILYEHADSRGYAVFAQIQARALAWPEDISKAGDIPCLAPCMALRQTSLSFEVITTSGEFLIASPTQNRDLYWALSGGGGGTYGIVWSVTIKFHKDLPITIATVEFLSENLSSDTFCEGINAFHASTLSYTAAGGFGFSAYTTKFFRLKPLAFPNITSTAVAEIVQPLLSSLELLGISYIHSLTTYPGFLNAVRHITESADYGVGLQHFGGRLLPGSLWKDLKSFSRMTSVIREIIEDGGTAFDVAMRPSLQAERLLIPMLPWDDYASWDEILQTRNKVTWTFDEPLRRLAPDSGAYLNEADTSEPDWKTALYGKNYARLLAIKDRYDPAQLLYGSTAVGGDRWIETEHGRLCPA